MVNAVIRTSYPTTEVASELGGPKMGMKSSKIERDADSNAASDSGSETEAEADEDYVNDLSWAATRITDNRSRVQPVFIQVYAGIAILSRTSLLDPLIVTYVTRLGEVGT